MSQVRRQLAIFTANHEIAFRASLSSAGTKLLRILSPEEWLLSRVPISVAGGATVARPGATIYQCTALPNFLKGWSPEEMLPFDPCENREENNMPRSTLRKNLT
jgi:hypothetical protein